MPLAKELKKLVIVILMTLSVATKLIDVTLAKHALLLKNVPEEKVRLLMDIAMTQMKFAAELVRLAIIV